MKLSEHATWKGKLITDLTREEMLEALADKISELMWCHQVMTLSQQLRVAERIKDAGL